MNRTLKAVRALAAAGFDPLVLTVDDAGIVAAMRLLWERLKVVVEPSGAVPLAAVLKPRFAELQGLGRVGIVLSGGNVDLEHLPW